MRTKFELYSLKKKPNRWAWRLFVNGRLICKSRPYSRKRDVIRSFERTKQAFIDAKASGLKY